MRNFFSIFFFFNDTATTEIYTLSLHDALPIFLTVGLRQAKRSLSQKAQDQVRRDRRHLVEPRLTELALHIVLLRKAEADRKSTRLNSSHANISYAVFCLKKKKREPAACAHH